MAPEFADDIGLDGPAALNARAMRHLMERGPDCGYFPESEKWIHVCDRPEDVEAAKAIFTAAGLKVIFHDGH
eukprot:5358389-Ditylum_brightwellii.AAC.1